MKNGNQKQLIYLMLMAFVLPLTGCKTLNDIPPEGLSIIADFSNGQTEQFISSHGYKNGDPFDVYWNRQEVSYENGEMSLSISKKDDKLFAGEVKSQQYFLYGDFEVTMKPEKKVGTASTFFIYVGPDELDENGNSKPHDEIDIEFLGKDTTKVQFNFFTDGIGGNEKIYDLGFDASEEYHTYSFRWAEDYITWFVDGKPVYRVNETSKKVLPSTPARIMMNYWSGNKKAEGWMGEYAGPKNEEKTSYLTVKSNSEPIGEITPYHEPPKYYDYDWDDVVPLSSLNFVSSNNVHNIISDNDKHIVQYNNIPGESYYNIMAGLGDVAENCNFAHLKIKNNSINPVNARVDIVGKPTTIRENNSTICNVEATINGDFASTNLEWGGSSFESILPNETAELVIYYEGNAETLQIMFDSFMYQDTNLYSGNVEIEDIKFAKIGDLYLPKVGEEI